MEVFNLHKKESLLKLAIFNNYQYDLPSDPEQQIFDFYSFAHMGASLENLPKPKSDVFIRENISDLKNNILDQITKKLKPNLLQAVFLAICSEFRHIFDNGYTDKLAEKFKKINKLPFLKEYAKYFNLFDSPQSHLFRDRNPKRIEKYKKELFHKARLSSYKAIKKTGINDEDFVSIAKWAFNNLNFSSQVGGSKWAEICEGYEKLNKAVNTKDIVIAIDHVYDLQHNTNTVFDKVESFKKNGDYRWIKKALDYKANDLKSFYDLIFDKKISPQLEEPLLSIIGANYGTSYEWYISNKEKDQNQLNQTNQTNQTNTQNKPQNQSNQTNQTNQTNTQNKPNANTFGNDSENAFKIAESFNFDLLKIPKEAITTISYNPHLSRLFAY